MAAAAYSLPVTFIEHFTERFRFRIERPAGFRFASGQFIMVGLMVDGKPLDAYWMANPHWDEELSFIRSSFPMGTYLGFSISKSVMRLRSAQAVGTSR